MSIPPSTPNPGSPVPLALNVIDEGEPLAQTSAEVEEAKPEDLAESVDVINAIVDPANDEIFERLKNPDS